MFDVSFGELMLVGVIALIVIGPERLPKVARTLGHLIGRAQRYVSDVKGDIQREMDLGDLTSLKDQMQDAAKSVKASMDDAGNSLRQPLDEAQKALKDASASVDTLIKAETAAIKSDQTPGVAGAASAAALATELSNANAVPLPADTTAMSDTHVPDSNVPGKSVPDSTLVELGSAASLIDFASDPQALEPVPTPGSEQVEATPELVELGSQTLTNEPAPEPPTVEPTPEPAPAIDPATPKAST